MKPTSLLAVAVLTLSLAACDRHRASQTTLTSGTKTSQESTTTGGTTAAGAITSTGTDSTGNVIPKAEPTASDFGRDASALGSGTRIDTGTTNIGVGHGGALRRDGGR